MACSRNSLNNIENAIEKLVSAIAIEMHNKDKGLSINDVLRPIAYAYIRMETANKTLSTDEVLNASRQSFEKLATGINGSSAIDVLTSDSTEPALPPKTPPENGRRKHNPLQDLHILDYANRRGHSQFDEDGLINHLTKHNIDYHKPTLRNTLSRFCKDKRFLTKNKNIPKTYTINEAGVREMEALAARHGWPS